MNPAQSPHIQEGAESILDHAQPLNPPTDLTFWQTCKANPWQAAVALLVVLGLVAALLSACSPDNSPAVVKAPVQTTTQAEPVQTTEAQSQPKITPNKVAHKAIKTPTSGANSSEFDDVLGDFIAQIEREKAQIAAVNVAPAMPAPSASHLEQDLSLKAPSPPFPPFPLN